MAMLEPRTVEPFSLDMRDVEVAARSIAAAEAVRAGVPGHLLLERIEANWPRWVEAAKQVIGDLDGERLRRALFGGGDMAKLLVATESYAADAQAYRAVLTP